MAQFTAFVNENKISVRYGVVATVGALSVYAISQTPLFFRYKTATELPSTLHTVSESRIDGQFLERVLSRGQIHPESSIQDIRMDF
jgi:hypothetical protein